MNKNLREDELWRGRFYVRQMQAFWERFDDGSGGIFVARLQIRDLKTGTYWNFSVDNYDSGYKLWDKVNKFIVEDSGVWKNIDEVKSDKTNWSKVKWNPVKEV